MKYTPVDKGFDCCSDADFSGNYNHKTAADDPSTAKSRSGCVIFYAGCPIYWASKLQTEIALSSTKSEYISLPNLSVKFFHSCGW
jgi:hypothetical protein